MTLTAEAEASPQVRSRPPRRHAIIHVAALIGAILLWIISIQRVDPRQMTDLGLLSVLPVSAYVALAVIAVSFCVLLARAHPNRLVLASHLGAAVLIIHGTPAILYNTLRYSWAWKHVGVVDYIQRHGSIAPGIKVLGPYHDWSGFLGGSALLTMLSGLSSALSFASWAPVFFNVLFLVGVYFVVSAFTENQRLIWFTTWLFLLTSWVAQDYFAPQSFAFFLYLVVVGICVRWFLTDRSRSATHWQRAGLAALVLVLLAAITVSHQLTPFLAISSLTALVVFARCRPRLLPIAMIVFTGLWAIYPALPFFSQNAHEILRSLGQIDGNASSAVVRLQHVSSGQRIVALMDRLLTGAVWGLAVLGFCLRLRKHHHDRACMVLALSPFALLAANAYGGEILLRVYFFALPFMIFFVASLVYPRPQARMPRLRAAWSIGLSLALLVGFGFAYYGKEQVNYFTTNEVNAVKYLYRTAHPGATFVRVTANTPWLFENYELYKYESLVADTDVRPTPPRHELINSLIGWGSDLHPDGVYVLLTRSQRLDASFSGQLGPGTMNAIEAALARSPDFQVVYRNRDAVIYQTFGTASPSLPSRARVAAVGLNAPTRWPWLSVPVVLFAVAGLLFLASARRRRGYDASRFGFVKSSPDAGDVFVLALTVLVGAMQLANLSWAVRFWITLLFLAICPGLAIVRAIGASRSIATTVALVAATSMALSVLCAEVMLYTHTWSPDLGLAVLAVVTFAMVGVRLGRRPDRTEQEV